MDEYNTNGPEGPSPVISEGQITQKLEIRNPEAIAELAGVSAAAVKPPATRSR